MCSISARSRFMSGVRLLGSASGQGQLQAGERGAQVVAHRGQQGGALLDVALDAAAHGQEGGGGLAHLLGPVRLEGRAVVAAPERLRRALASRSMARTWLRMNSSAMAVSSTVATVIQRTKMWPWVAKARSRGARIRITPPSTPTRMST
jgi:hypothetical protein